MPDTKVLRPVPNVRFSAELTDPAATDGAWIPVEGFAPVRTESAGFTIQFETPLASGRFSAAQLRALEAASSSIPDPVCDEDDDL